MLGGAQELLIPKLINRTYPSHILYSCNKKKSLLDLINYLIDQLISFLLVPVANTT